MLVSMLKAHIWDHPFLVASVVAVSSCHRESAHYFWITFKFFWGGNFFVFVEAVQSTDYQDIESTGFQRNH